MTHGFSRISMTSWRHLSNFEIVQSMFPPTYMLNKTTFIAKTEKRHVPTIWNWSVYPPTHMLNKTTFISKTEKRHVAIIWISKCKSTHALLNISHFLWNNGTRPVKICKTISCDRTYNVLMINGKLFEVSKMYFGCSILIGWFYENVKLVSIFSNKFPSSWQPRLIFLNSLRWKK